MRPTICGAAGTRFRALPALRSAVFTQCQLRLALARIASIVVAGLTRLRVDLGCRIAGLPDLAALNRSANCSVFSIVAPNPPNARA